MDNRFSVGANITEARMNQNRGTKVSNDKPESLNFYWKKIERCTAIENHPIGKLPRILLSTDITGIFS